MGLSKQDAARLMGMREVEIVSVKPVAGGHVVITHDLFRTLITDSGEFVFGAEAIAERLAPPEELAEATDDGSAVFTLMPAGAGVPSGTAADVLAWVGEDRERAGLALAAEQGRDKPRAGLVSSLERLVG